MKKMIFQILCLSFITFLSNCVVAQNHDMPLKIYKNATQEVGAQSSTPPPPPPPPPPPVTGCDMVSVIEVMPRFNGCEDQGLNKKDLEDCSKQKMLDYIYDNLVYPEEAKKKKIEGIAIVQFTIDKDGSIINPKLVRDIDGGCGQAALDIVSKMQANHKWIPGTRRGRLVKVLYNLPIKFKL